MGAVESLRLGGVLDVRAGSELLLAEVESIKIVRTVLGAQLRLLGKGLNDFIDGVHRVGVDAKHLADGVLELQGVHFALNELLNVIQS